MLFGNAYVKDARGEAVLHHVDACAGRHGGRDTYDARITRGLVRERLTKDRGIAGSVGF